LRQEIFPLLFNRHLLFRLLISITPIQPITPAFQTPKPLIPPITAPKPAIVQPMAERMNKLPQRGTLGSTFQGGKIKKRFLADLPANVQLQGINNILSGQNTSSAMVNTFVRTLARQGKTPEQIRQAFIAQQRTSPNPLVIM